MTTSVYPNFTKKVTFYKNKLLAYFIVNLVNGKDFKVRDEVIEPFEKRDQKIEKKMNDAAISQKNVQDVSFNRHNFHYFILCCFKTPCIYPRKEKNYCQTTKLYSV